MSDVDRFADQRRAFELRHKHPPTNGTLVLVERAEEEAIGLSHNYIGTPHLLLGAFATAEGASPLLTLGVNADQVRDVTASIIGKGDSPVVGRIGLTPRSKRVMENSVKEAKGLYDLEVGPDHVLLALSRETGSDSEDILKSCGVYLKQLRETVLEERTARLMTARHESVNPFANLAAVRRLLLHPSTSTQDQELIGAALGLIYRTYGPKPRTGQF